MIEETKIDVLAGKESWPIDKITFLKAESAVKVYFGDKAGYKRMLGHLDTLSSLMGSERKFVYDGDEANSNIIFTRDVAQAFELFKGYELLTDEMIKRILEKSGMPISDKSASIEQEFEESKYIVPVQKNPKKTKWGCSNNMYKTEGSSGQQKKSPANDVGSKKSIFKFKSSGVATL